ncbi:carbamoyl phosphate synthase small subunit [Alkalicoccus urumqiensis]|uniref:Carbamoyl phosphate synthase small chain n=1 Tax=Alkalicoccus urumqiensis TaxID=1548213 RepID=A0A2P6MKY0_ALKUR|nr:carbamoyl phosphate synthase small subunit [Alkalicoccus urumqiensis]PRO66925.1 carbamoyl phosphate synthase small subunit [Alkalicoccus urumqiensis]
MSTGYIVFETGEIFEGEWIGAEVETSGEVVFNTGMTGYQEMITDPSYKGQILTYSYPLIGNYGANGIDNESGSPSVQGVLTGESCLDYCHFEAVGGFSDYLQQHGVPGLTGVDTRAVVKAVRSRPTVRAVITKNPDTVSFEETEFPDGESLVPSVSVSEPHHTSGGSPHVVLMDYGHKHSIYHALIDAGCSVTVMPYNSSAEAVRGVNPDGVLFSNGPGDPMDLEEQFENIRSITKDYPSLGICLGHQLIALAYGASSEKMLFGHRGSNHPVKYLPDGSVHMTSQNHGYVISENSLDSTPFQPTFINVNDKSVEGMKHKELPVETVQFHPEAHPGPSDTHFIFQSFIEALTTGGRKPCTTASL